MRDALDAEAWAVLRDVADNPPDPSAPPLTGVWQHYKDPLYEAGECAHDADAADLRAAVDRLASLLPDPTDGQREALAAVYAALGSDEDGVREVVVYHPLQLDAAHEGFRTAVRTLRTWREEVCADPLCPHYGDRVPLSVDAADACEEVGCPPCHELGHVEHRFGYLGPRYTADMAPR